MREQRHCERLRERYESRQNTSEPEASWYRSLWPNPESAHYLLVDDCIPVCAFGQPMARIPPQYVSFFLTHLMCQNIGTFYYYKAMLKFRHTEI